MHGNAYLHLLLNSYTISNYLLVVIGESENIHKAVDVRGGHLASRVKCAFVSLLEPTL